MIGINDPHVAAIIAIKLAMLKTHLLINITKGDDFTYE
jgi:hypothetical protein